MKQSVKSKMPVVEEMVPFDKLVKQDFDGQKFIAWIDDDVKEQLCDLYKKGENAIVLIVRDSILCDSIQFNKKRANLRA